MDPLLPVAVEKLREVESCRHLEMLGAKNVPKIERKNLLIVEKDGVICCDIGKKVIVNTKALCKELGVVIAGPYKIKQIYRVNTKNKGIKKYQEIITEPYWLVRLNSNGFYLHFAARELKLE